MLTSFAEVERALPCVWGAAHHEAELQADLRARIAVLDPEERFVLERWYGVGAEPRVIACDLRRSVRHVYRRRRSAINRLVDLGRDNEFANVDIAEFG
jgi:FixJ family two-component response regulator